MDSDLTVPKEVNRDIAINGTPLNKKQMRKSRKYDHEIECQIVGLGGKKLVWLFYFAYLRGRCRLLSKVHQ